MWETPEEESISKLLDEMKSVFFTIPLYRGNGCGTSQRQTFIAGCFAESLSEHRPSVKNSLQEKPTRCHRCILESHTSVSDILAIPTNTGYILLIKANSHNDINSREVLTVRKHTHTHTKYL